MIPHRYSAFILATLLAAAPLAVQAAPAPASSLPELRTIHNKIAGAKFKSSDSRWSQKRILELLPHILNGEDVNISLDGMKGNTCLHYACELGSRSLIQWLVENGADVNRVEWGGGNTPLHCSARLASLYSVNYLLEHGANPDIANNEGLRPVDMVGNDDHDAICALLRSSVPQPEESQTAGTGTAYPIDVDAPCVLGLPSYSEVCKRISDIKQGTAGSRYDEDARVSPSEPFSMEKGNSPIRLHYTFSDLSADEEILYADDNYIVTRQSNGGEMDLWNSRSLGYLCSIMNAYVFPYTWLSFKDGRMNYFTRRGTERDLDFGEPCKREKWISLDLNSLHTEYKDCFGGGDEWFNDGEELRKPVVCSRYSRRVINRMPSFEKRLEPRSLSACPHGGILGNAARFASSGDSVFSLQSIDFSSLRVRDVKALPPPPVEKEHETARIFEDGKWWRLGSDGYYYVPEESGASSVLDYLREVQDAHSSEDYEVTREMVRKLKLYVLDRKTGRHYLSGPAPKLVEGARTPVCDPVYVGDSDCGMITQVAYCKAHFNEPSWFDYCVYDTKAQRLLRILEKDSTRWDKEYAIGGCYTVEKLPYREPGAQLFVNVWNRIPGTKDKYYWLTANDTGWAMYVMNGKALTGTQVCAGNWQAEYFTDEATNTRSIRRLPVFDQGEMKLYIPTNKNSWEVYLIEPSTSSARVLCNIYTKGTREFAVVLPNGHYAGTPGCEEFLYTVENGKRIDMRSLAPWRNRPGEVLKAMGGNPDDIVALNATTKRWLQRMGYHPDENNTIGAEPCQFPSCRVAYPPLETQNASAEFSVSVQAGTGEVTGIEVRVGGALAASQEIRGKGELHFSVPLAAGENMIEVTPVTGSGESRKVGAANKFRVICRASEPSALYVVTMGVSDYDDEGLRLQYAAKDAEDLAETFRRIDKTAHVLCLKDKDVRHDTLIGKLQDFLGGAKPGDRVVLHLAGHGVLDKSLDYYYVPSDGDVENIPETCISMEALSAAIQQLPARKRLLLLDTCHAGALGEKGAEEMALAMGSLPEGVRAVQTRGMKVNKAVSGLTSAQTKRYIEEMFSMGQETRGINIVAGSAGAEFARESESWRNGVFTATVMEVLRGEGPGSDTNADGEISVAEMLQYVRQKVSERTNGLQQPNITSAESAQEYPLCRMPGYYICEGDWDALSAALRNGGRLNDKVLPEGESWLASAMEKNAPVPLLEEIIRHGASVNRPVRRFSQMTPYESVHVAREDKGKGYKEELASLEKRSDLQQLEALMEKNGGDVNMFVNTGVGDFNWRELLKRGANPNGDSMKRGLRGWWPVAMKDPENMKTLIAAGMDVKRIDDSGNNILCCGTNLAAAKIAVENGADINAYWQHKDIGYSTRRSPILVAVEALNLDLLKYYISLGPKRVCFPEIDKSAIREYVGETIFSKNLSKLDLEYIRLLAPLSDKHSLNAALLVLVEEFNLYGSHFAKTQIHRQKLAEHVELLIQYGADEQIMNTHEAGSWRQYLPSRPARNVNNR
ncbi:MAG: caspase family protein [Akkermansia sp.]|nr:caspase family protein [Akkermansia sp.]